MNMIFCNMTETVTGQHLGHYIHRNVKNTSGTRSKKMEN